MKRLHLFIVVVVGLLGCVNALSKTNVATSLSTWTKRLSDTKKYNKHLFDASSFRMASRRNKVLVGTATGGSTDSKEGTTVKNNDGLVIPVDENEDVKDDKENSNPNFSWWEYWQPYLSFVEKQSKTKKSSFTVTKK